MTQIVEILRSMGDALFSTAEGSTGIVVTFFEWLTSAEVLPFVGISITISLVLLAIRVVKGSLYGL